MNFFSKASRSLKYACNIATNQTIRNNTKNVRLISTSTKLPLYCQQSDIANSDKKQSNVPFYNPSLFSANSTLQLKYEHKEMMAVFPEIVHTLTEMAGKYGAKEAATELAKALEYNVPHGKMWRGLTVIIGYKDLIDKSELTPKNIHLAYLLAWCIELIHSAFLIADDIIDRSEIRRNKPCWYKLDDVDTIAVNDAFIIENCAYYILKKNFDKLQCYTKLLEFFHKSAMAIAIGQSLDFHIPRKGIEHFTLNQFRKITDHKTSYFSSYAPIALPMILAGYDDPETFRQVKEICFEMGYFFQIQNDFLDCFADPDVLKKPGTDIEENKCTWLAATCMENATEQQKEILKNFYGRNDIHCVNEVKQVYQAMNLPELYANYENDAFKSIGRQIHNSGQNVPREMLLGALHRFFNRT